MLVEEGGVREVVEVGEDVMARNVRVCFVRSTRWCVLGAGGLRSG